MREEDAEHCLYYVATAKRLPVYLPNIKSFNNPSDEKFLSASCNISIFTRGIRKDPFSRVLFLLYKVGDLWSEYTIIFVVRSKSKASQLNKD